jgi:hypothetical protein
MAAADSMREIFCIAKPTRLKRDQVGLIGIAL